MKTTVKILAILSLLLGINQVYAQRIHAYVNAGAIGSQIEGDELKGMDHWGFTGGVGAYANLDERGLWGFAVETDYSCRGIYHNAHSDRNFYNIDLDLHYVDIPLTFFFHDPKGGIQVGLGLVYGRLVSQPHGLIKYNPDYFIPDTNDMQFLKNDLAPAIELRFNFWKGLSFSARYQYSILKVKKDWHFNYVHGQQSWANDCYNQSVQIRLLWEFGYEENQYGTHKKTSKKRRY